MKPRYYDSSNNFGIGIMFCIIFVAFIGILFAGTYFARNYSMLTMKIDPKIDVGTIKWNNNSINFYLEQTDNQYWDVYTDLNIANQTKENNLLTININEPKTGEVNLCYHTENSETGVQFYKIKVFKNFDEIDLQRIM